MQVRACRPEDIPSICDIYNHYILNTAITFEEEPVTVDTMQQRIEAYTKVYPWFVCEDAGRVVGYAYATKWRERAAYRHSCEITVYVDKEQGRKGYGKALYAELLTKLGQSCHLILAGIALPNDASVGIHESFGFQKVAHFSQVGRKFNQWVDVGYWQKVIQADVE